MSRADYQGNVYVLGDDRFGCYSLTNGATRRERKYDRTTEDPEVAKRADGKLWEITSAIVADGKVICLMGGVVHMFKASPEGCVELGKAELDPDWPILMKRWINWLASPVGG